jgi:hypothetical protein
MLDISTSCNTTLLSLLAGWIGETGHKPGKVRCAGLVLALTSALPAAANPIPSATGYGPDDFNTSTLISDSARFLFTKTFVDDAKKGTPFENWQFTMADTLISQFHLKVTLYEPFVVKDVGVHDPGGDVHNYFIFDDVGGVNFSLTYTPQDSGEPKASVILPAAKLVSVRSKRLDFRAHGHPNGRWAAE